MQPIAAVFTIPQDSLPAVLTRLRAGGAPEVDAYDREQKAKLATGKLLTADNQIDPTTGTIKLKAQFPNEDGSLFPNQFINLRLHLDTLRQATIIPSAAVQRGVQGTFVYVLKDDKTVALRPIRVGASEGENVMVDSGVSPGEVVVVEGSDRLRDGAKAEVPDPASRSGAEGGAPKGGKGGKGGRSKKSEP
jgi:multidrug efflux system membrane fusion protein